MEHKSWHLSLSLSLVAHKQPTKDPNRPDPVTVADPVRAVECTCTKVQLLHANAIFISLFPGVVILH